jgi:hypothetical protein
MLALAAAIRYRFGGRICRDSADQDLSIMTDPFTVTAVGATVLSEGIKFLYGQAGELLKRWRERRDGQTPTVAADLRVPPGILAGTVSAVTPNDQILDRVHAELSDLRKDLLDYAEGEPVDPADSAAAANFDALRRIVEVIYGQRITLTGEDREPSGPLVEAEVNVDSVRGDVAALRARAVKAGTVRAKATGKNVEPGGRLSAVELSGDIGG